MFPSLQNLNRINQLVTNNQATKVGPITPVPAPAPLNAPQQQGFFPGLLSNIKKRGQTFVTRLGGIDPADQAMATQADLDEARYKGRRELFARLSDAFLGEDISAGIAQRQQGRLAMMQKEDEEKRQKFIQEFFDNPKYQDMAKLAGFEFAFAQQQRDIELSQEEEANKLFAKNVEGTPYEDLIKIVGFEEARDAYIANELKPKDLPVGLQKLEMLQILKEKLETDPDYTEEQFNLDAAVIGIPATLLNSRQDFIIEIAKEYRKQKTWDGKPLYNEPQIRELAEQAYALYFPKETENQSESNEEVIDLGAFPPRDD